jgi:hypothetical protein
MSLFAWLQGAGASVSDADIRSEIWTLGTRYHGQPLEGALGELADPRLSSDRAQLLRAGVRKLRQAPA